MGKRLRQQRRGRGTSTFRAKRRGIKAEYVSLNEKQRASSLQGQVIDLLKESGRNSILALVMFEDDSTNYVIAAEGMAVGQSVAFGRNAAIAIGNVLPLAGIPEGCPIFDIEKEPGDGGKLARGSGAYALLVSRDNRHAYVKLPSGKTLALNPANRATIGCSAGGGRKEKPMVKAGNRFHFMAARSRHYPSVRGVAMNPPDHPFGGSQHHAGKSKSSSRHAPPGRKVGSIASKRTGRRKR